MGLSQRMSRLRSQLIDIRIGPGAALLPRDLHRVQLDISQKAVGGQLAGLKVWREYLPRLKYHNPAVAMIVNRVPEADAPSTMTLWFEGGRQEKIEMMHRKESEILEQLLTLTKATPVVATSEDEAELRRIAEQKIKSEKHRAQSRIKFEEKRREEDILAQARAAVENAQAE